ncbi:LysM peptidoglycan-binding domain-containing protein [Thalassococcus sp. CAU 1522]|uniref:LysM peptidoglycan-binding domain-containing protein n=1 Tax=Thalassococcus arenae TaxID=2851652 RepID=A0ABS6N6H1_9RHOB|nr:LysM peptidoglycan-binding domain-containing protein [Thalassococcus arenae]MBV2359199.1 LysM peptidoglycan-binding domain-containing protein [Thalassococcus arenae]
MIRMFLLCVGFVAVSVLLLVYQPGARRLAREDAADHSVTRAEPRIAPIAAPEPEPRQYVAQSLSAPAPLPEPPAPVPIVQPGFPPGPLDAAGLRRMTWETVSNLDAATGRKAVPGQPGSLLHSIVRKSLSELDSPIRAERYVVQSGDSLISIAVALYGDANMTGPLFAANQDILARPDDLRAGQVLVLPRD